MDENLMLETDKRYFIPSAYYNYIMEGVTPKYRYTLENYEEWKANLGKELKELVGLSTDIRVPLDVRVLWKRQTALGTIEKIVFCSEPFSDVPAYFCIPHQAVPPYKVIICLQGHNTGMHVSLAIDRNDECSPIEVKGDRDIAVQCMKNGIAALCIEQRGFGERILQHNKESKVCHDPTMYSFMLGKTMVGERVYDVDRAIDYLEARGDIQMKLVGIMGNSAGGTTSLFAAALLPRIAFAVPSCCFAPLRESRMTHHFCMCTYIPGLYKLADLQHIAGLIAPRPLVLVAGEKDGGFPIDSVYRGFEEVKSIYRAAGMENNCQLVVGKEGHRFYAQEAWKELNKIFDRASECKES